MNLVTIAMHNAGINVMQHNRPALVIADNGVVRVDYQMPDPTAIYNAMEKARIRAPYEHGTLEQGDSQRLEWLANSGQRMERLGSNWRVRPQLHSEEFASNAWYPSMREAIDAARREA